MQLDDLCGGGDITLLVVEHDMQFVGALCEEVVVISFGRKIADGTPDEIRHNALVQEVYLGTSTGQAEGEMTPPSEERSRAALRA